MPRWLETCITCARLFSGLVEGKCEECRARIDPGFRAELKRKREVKGAATVLACIRCGKNKSGEEFLTVPIKTHRGTCRECIKAKSATIGGRPKMRDPEADSHTCTTCHQTLPAHEFRIDRKGYVEGRCRLCAKVRMRVVNARRSFDLDATIDAGFRNLS